MAEIISLTGTVQHRIMTCLKAAGWYEGRAVDLTEVRAFYASGGITLPKGAEDFLREYYGLAEMWYLRAEREQLMNPRLASQIGEIEFGLYPRRGLPQSNSRFFYSDEGDRQALRRAEKAAGEALVFLGCIGYEYPAGIYLGSTHKIYTDHEYDDTVHCYNSLPALLEYDFLDVSWQMQDWNFAAMRQVCYPLHDPRNVID